MTTNLPLGSVVTFVVTYGELASRSLYLYEQPIYIRMKKVWQTGSYEISATALDGRNITVLSAVGESSAIQIDDGNCSTFVSR